MRWLSMVLALVCLAVPAQAAETPPQSVWEAPPAPVAEQPADVPVLIEDFDLPLARTRLQRARTTFGIGAGLAYGGLALIAGSAFFGGMIPSQVWGTVALLGIPMALTGPALMLSASRMARMAAEPRRWSRKEMLGAIFYGVGAGLMPAGIVATVLGFAMAWGGGSAGALVMLVGMAAAVAGGGLFVTGTIFSHVAASRELRATGRRLAVVPWHRRDGGTTGLALVGAF